VLLLRLPRLLLLLVINFTPTPLVLLLLRFLVLRLQLRNISSVLSIHMMVALATVRIRCQPTPSKQQAILRGGCRLSTTLRDRPAKVCQKCQKLSITLPSRNRESHKQLKRGYGKAASDPPKRLRKTAQRLYAW